MSDADTRLLFRYLGGDEAEEYRLILGVFAGTFFAEFAPDEVHAALRAAGVSIEADVVPTRLESLRGWGNLTVSSAVGRPSSLDDYYKRRHRYLITRVGQEVFEFAENLFATVDQIGDVQVGRLRDLLRALTDLERLTDSVDAVVEADAQELSDAVRRVFELHDGFTTELTQFFAELNQLQARYDLSADEVQFFANVLVNYVAEQLTEIEQSMRPIGQALGRLQPRLAQLLPRLTIGLAGRTERAGHSDDFNIRRVHGATIDDWDHLAAWFLPVGAQQPRLEQLTRQAFAAVRTLTANLTRLSRESLGAASRRADFSRLASWFHDAVDVEAAHDLASAAFGMGSCRTLSMVAEDQGDPVASSTPWKAAPRAVVPVALRARGDVSQRGATTPVRDSARERDLMRRRRELERVAAEQIRAELLAVADEHGRLDDVDLSVDAFRALRDGMGRARLGGAADAVACELSPRQGDTVLRCAEGAFTLRNLAITVRLR